MVIEDDSKNYDMLELGYVRIGDYVGDTREAYQGKRGYYQSSVGGQNPFRQGVLQTVHDTWQGVDAKTGVTLGGETGGVIRGTRVSRIAKSVDQNAGKNDNQKAGAYLIPIFNAIGQVVAYERPLEPAKLTGLKKDTHLGRMLGVWLGRILEEDQADRFNTETVEMAYELWDKNKGDGRQFINVADPKNTDPVVRDAWDTMGWRVKSEAETMFGKDTFWVRKDMVNDLVGYRAAGVSDAWTGITRWSPEMQRGFKEVGMVLFGTKAYRYLSTAEGAIEDVMSAVKTTIIVRSIVVMRDNLTANLLGARGYDANLFHDTLIDIGIPPSIQSRRGRKEAIPHDADLYRQRHKIENMFAR